VRSSNLCQIAILFLTLLAAVIVVPAEAQTVSNKTSSYDFRGESLERVLDTIARDTGIDLVYDPELVRGREVFKRVDDQTLAEMLRLILSDYDLDYITLSSGTIVIIQRAADAPAYGTLSGIIVDSRTGEPLPGATVMFADAAGGTSAGQMGQFSINKMISGEHTLIFSFVGYRAVTKQIMIPPGRQISETIELRPGPVDISPIVVEAHRPQVYRLEMSQPGNGLSLNDNSWNSGPIRDLSIIPGITSGVPMAEIALQGGQESEHRVRLDGAPVYSPYSTGRLFNSFSPYAIGSVQVQRAGYDAREGSQIAGLIDLSHDLPTKDRNGLMLQADPLSVNARGNLSHSLSDQSSLSVMSVFRTNIWGVYKDPVMEETLRNWDVIDPLITNSVSERIENAEDYVPFNHQSDLSFHDFHAAIRYKANTFNTVTLSVYDSGNSLNTAVLNRSLSGSQSEPYLYAAESYEWKNRMAQLSWSSLPTPRLGVDSQISYSRSAFSHGSELGYGIPLQFRANAEGALSSDSGFQFSSVELPSNVKGNSIEHLVLKSDISYSINPAVDLLGGFQADRVISSLDSGEKQNPPALFDVTSTMLGGYATGSFRFSRYWHLNTGSRFTYLNEAGRLYAEPRVSLQVDSPEAGIGYWSGKISGGLYRQFINEYRVSNSGATSVVPTFSIWSHAGTLPVPKAFHLTGSWYFEPSDKSTLRVEGYLKWQPVTSITSYRLGSAGNESDERGRTDIFAETTEMRASGVGLRYQRSLFGSSLKLLAGYDYSYATIDMETQFSRTVSTPWNDPHRGQIRALWSVSNDLTLIGKWQGIWGRTWAYRDSYYSYLQIEGQQSAPGFDFSTPDDDRLPYFSQVDVSTVYSPDIGGIKMEFRLDLINVLNRSNPVDRYLRPVTQDGGGKQYETADRTLPGFYPTVSIKLSI